MILKLTTTQVTGLWDHLWKQIKRSLPEHDQTTESSLLTEATNGTFEIWTLHTNDEKEQVRAVVSTTFMLNTIDRIKNLIIYTLTNVTNVPLTYEEYKELFTTLSKYARGQKCKNLVFYTNEQTLVDLAKEAGGEVQSMVMIDITGTGGK